MLIPVAKCHQRGENASRLPKADHHSGYVTSTTENNTLDRSVCGEKATAGIAVDKTCFTDVQES